MLTKSCGQLCLSMIRALVVGYAYFFSVANAAPGDLDSTFGVGGKVTTSIATKIASDLSYGSLKQPDGKLLTLGQCSAVESYELPCMARFASDGVLDNTFGVAGVVRIEFIAGGGGGFRTAIIDGNRIVAAGRCSADGGIARICLARMHLDGSLDATFGNAGKLVLPPIKTFDIAFALAVDASGKYLVGGSCQEGAIGHACVARVDANGVLDASFNGTGVLATFLGFYRAEVGDIVIAGDKVLVAGTCQTTIKASICVTRINSDGNTDTSFNSSGTYVSGIGETGDLGGRVQLYQSKLYVSGTCRQSEIRSSFCLFRLNDNGTLDTAFNGAGFVRTFILSQDSYAIGMAIQNDKIVVGGNCTTGGGEYFCWARYELNG
jgi:uncharacterized delta-60 repeat protein